MSLTHRRPVDGPATPPTDLRDAVSVMSTVSEASPLLIVHAAYAKDRASIIDATQNLVDAANGVGSRLVFISTDAVFAGDGVARGERDHPDAVWDYGRWKHEAEQIVLNHSDGGAVVRLPLLVSVEPDDHVVREIRSGAKAEQPTRWFSDERRQPVRASEAAAGIWQIAGLRPAERLGVWHLAGAEGLSRFEIACRLVEALGLPAAAIEPSFQADNTDRPRDIALSDARARAVIGWAPSLIP